MESNDINTGINDDKNVRLIHSHPKSIASLKQDCDLAEFLGMYYGDGSATENLPVVTISLSYSKEKEYAYFIAELLYRILGVKAGIVEHKQVNNIQVRIYRVNLVRILKSNVKREKGMPDWIKVDNNFLISFIRGLMDCESCIYRVEKGKRRIRLELRLYNSKVLEEVNAAFVSLGYPPRIYPARNRLVIAKQDEVDRYFREVCPHNPKHMKRYLSLRENHLRALR